MSAPLILAIDTSGPIGGLALARGGDLIEAVTMDAPDGHGHHLFGHLEALLRRHSLGVAHVDCFAAAAGPGSFTGLRIALSAVKGLAEAVSKPAIGVSNLQALAWHGSAAVRAPHFPAGRGEFYCGLFDSALVPLQAETVGALETWKAGLPEAAELITLDGSLAKGVAAMAFHRWKSGDIGSALSLDANYVRRSDAELNWRDS